MLRLLEIRKDSDLYLDIRMRSKYFEGLLSILGLTMKIIFCTLQSLVTSLLYIMAQHNVYTIGIEMMEYIWYASI